MGLSVRTVMNVIVATVTTFSISAHAQESDWEKAFWDTAKKHAAEFEKTTNSHFEQMRGKFNAEYAEGLNGVWKMFEVKAPAPTPLRDEPKQQPVAPDPGQEPSHPVRIVPDKIVPAPIALPTVPLTLPQNPVITLPARMPSLKLDYFGAACEIGRYTLPPVRYNAEKMRLGDEWQKMNADTAGARLLDDCLRLREAMSLCDMGYLWLCERVASTLHPDDSDSQSFLVAYLMNQSGYDVKLGLTPKGLTVLMNTDLPISGYYSLKIDNKRYYIRNMDLGLQQIATPDCSFAPNETIPLRMVPDRMPLLDPDRLSTVSYSSSRWIGEPELKVTVSKPEMEFFKDYPWMSWEHYVRAPISENFRNQVVEPFRTRLKGLNAFDGVRKLLAYVQFGFDYMTDKDQYGREKVNFPEENFYYPANDCEDRSILFSTLVREIYGLDVVLLHYDRHLSTAVDFGDPTIKGDFINIDGHHYVMCDPTFIGARIGMSMPQYKGQQPEVYRR